tara:strand:+ start:346 stop:1344 length:999 start_codon:yes stop_codon:yes gene_type:complete
MVLPKVSGVEFDAQIESTGLRSKITNALWGISFLLRNGIPKKAYRFGGGLGDHLMTSAVFHEFRRRGFSNLWMMSDNPDLFLNNTDIDKVVPDNWMTHKYCSRVGATPTVLSYGKWINDNDRIDPPRRHIIAEILEKAGIHGEVKLRPYYFTKQTKANKPKNNRIICIQGANTSSSTPMLNKQWHPSRFVEIANILNQHYELHQIGLKGESDIPVTKDFRGQLSIAQTAEVLSNARFFIGQVGFLMHLARAVNTRSIIIYGGREKAKQSGYPCNENLEAHPECSPCWRNNECEFNRECLDDIKVSDVLSAVERIETRLTNPLETERAFISST